MPWVKKLKDKKSHECRKPWFIGNKAPGSIWMCPRCKKYWFYVYSQEGVHLWKLYIGNPYEDDSKRGCLHPYILASGFCSTCGYDAFQMGG